MKTLFLSSLLALCSLFTLAQSKIAVQSGTSVSFYENLQTAVDNAADGDDILLPGGVYTNASFNLNKAVNLIGVGHYADSTVATGITMITGIFYINGAAAGGSVQGIYFSDAVRFGTASGNEPIDGYSITRCSMPELSLSFNNQPGIATNILIKDNVIRGQLYIANAQNVLVETNHIDGQLVYVNGLAQFNQNIFHYTSSNYLFNSVIGGNFTNNIVLYNYFNWQIMGGSANTFLNNIFVTSSFLGGSNIGSDNQFEVAFDEIFVNSPVNTIFNYNDDYHAADGGPADGTGLGGTDVGVYGGNNPYKDGAVPSNPHIRSKAIDGTTNAQGLLNVTIEAAAQEN
jgi:hypothetical protein